MTVQATIVDPSIAGTSKKRTGQIQIEVLWALMLHDIKGRFFGNGLGYVMTILWPSAHIVVIMIAYSLSGRQVYGTSKLLFVATGVLPYIFWNYISRFCLLSAIQNRQFLEYPIVKPLDLMISRLLLEIFSSFIMLVVLVIILSLMQIDVMPRNLVQAAFGILSAVLLGVGFGIFHGVLTMIWGQWSIVYVLFLIGFWMTSGVAINPEQMPVEVGSLFAWNPLLHCIEWVRSAYYVDYPAHLLNKTYVLTIGFGSLGIGLIMERYLREFTRRR